MRPTGKILSYLSGSVKPHIHQNHRLNCIFYVLEDNAKDRHVDLYAYPGDLIYVNTFMFNSINLSF